MAIGQRIERFHNRFFTSITPAEAVETDKLALLPPQDRFLPSDLWQELASLIVPVTPAGLALFATVEDLEAQTRLKAAKARQAIELSFHLLAQDLLTACHWIDIRRLQDPSRRLGDAPGQAHAALRQVVPLLQPLAERPQRPVGELVYEFMQSQPASTFYASNTPPTGLREP